MSLEHLPLWDGATALIAASGPSIAELDARDVPESVRVVAVKDTWALFPQAKIVYGCDWEWWLARGPRTGPALKVVGKMPAIATSLPEEDMNFTRTLTRIHIEPGSGPMVWHGPRVRGGWNSAFQIVNAMARRGVKRFLLAGVDCDAPHSYAHGGTYPGQHPQTQDNVDVWLDQWRIAAAELNARGIEIFNCSPRSRVDAFQKIELHEALKETA